MNTQMILNELSLIFQEILKRDNIVLASETTAQDVEGWNSLTNMLLISRIEKDFNVHFTFRDIVRFKNVGAENLKAFDEEERRILAYQFATREREVEFGQCVKHDSEGKCKRGGEYACANCNKICTGKQYLPKWESLYNNQLDIVRDLETEYNNDEISKEEYSEYIEYIREVKQLNYYKNVIEKIKDRG